MKAKKSRNVNENAKDINRREKIIEQIYIVECTQRYSNHVKCRLERFKRPAAVIKTDYSHHQSEAMYMQSEVDSDGR